MKFSRFVACGFAALFSVVVSVSSVSAATCSPTGKCKACTTCSSCKHCSRNGGSCSVCRGGAKEEKVSGTEKSVPEVCGSSDAPKSGDSEEHS